MIIGKAFGDYRILAKLRSGECGCVYKALHSRHRELFGLVLLKGAPARENPLQRMFLEKLDLATGVHHPGVGQTYPLEACGEFSGIPLEYVHGQRLSDRVRSGQSSFDFTLKTAIQAAEGLASAHSIGLVHGHLNPDCLLEVWQGGLKILDFALAFLPEELRVPEPSSAVQAASQAIGKTEPPVMSYLSPEQLEGQPADQRSDLFSLGRILYELLLGEFLIESPDPDFIKEQILERDLPDLSDVRREASTHWTATLRKLTNRKVSERYSSAQGLLEDLRKLRDGYPPPYHPFQQKNRSMSRRSFFLRFLGEEKKWG
jgi:serine/threonine-protein kinase